MRSCCWTQGPIGETENLPRHRPRQLQNKQLSREISISQRVMCLRWFPPPHHAVAQSLIGNAPGTNARSLTGVRSQRKASEYLFRRSPRAEGGPGGKPQEPAAPKHSLHTTFHPRWAVSQQFHSETP